MSSFSALREAFLRKNLDGVLFLDEYERGFFSGFWSSSGIFVVLKKSVHFFTDARYLSAARDFFRSTEVEVADFFSEKTSAQKFFSTKKGRRLGTDFGKISAERLTRLRRNFGVSILSFSAEEIRAQKTKEHILAAEQAAAIADSALLEAIKTLKTGVSEKDFAWTLEKIGRETFGADSVSFSPIIAFGANSAVPHHAPTETKLTAETPILIDWGFVKNRLCSDCTRNFWFGRNPSSEWKEVGEKVLAAQQSGRDEIRAGAKISAVQKAAEKVLSEKIPHAFGHGVGVEVHEFPTLSTKSRGVFTENMLVTAEPGLYYEGKFGIRIEDMLVVEKNGARTLTKLPREPMILGKNGVLTKYEK